MKEQRQKMTYKRTQKKRFTMIEMIIVVVLLSIMAAATVTFALDLVQNSIALQDTTRQISDTQFLLLRISKEVTSYQAVVSVAADHKSMQTKKFEAVTPPSTIPSTTNSSVTWDSANKLLYIGAGVIHNNVTHFNVTKVDNQLNISISVGSSSVITTSVLLR